MVYPGKQETMQSSELLENRRLQLSSPLFRFFVPTSAILLITILLAAGATAKNLVLSETDNKYVLGKYVDYLLDSDHSLTIEEISAQNGVGDFQRSDSHVPSFGFTSSAIWLRLTIENPLAEDTQLFLEVKNSYLDRVDLFTDDGVGGWIEERTGELLPFDTRSIKRGTFIFPISVPQQGSKTYFLRFAGRLLAGTAEPTDAWDPL